MAWVPPAISIGGYGALHHSDSYLLAGISPGPLVVYTLSWWLMKRGPLLGIG